MLRWFENCGLSETEEGPLIKLCTITYSFWTLGTLPNRLQEKNTKSNNPIHTVKTPLEVFIPNEIIEYAFQLSLK